MWAARRAETETCVSRGGGAARGQSFLPRELLAAPRGARGAGRTTWKKRGWTPAREEQSGASRNCPEEKLRLRSQWLWKNRLWRCFWGKTKDLTTRRRINKAHMFHIAGPNKLSSNHAAAWPEWKSSKLIIIEFNFLILWELRHGEMRRLDVPQGKPLPQAFFKCCQEERKTWASKLRTLQPPRRVYFRWAVVLGENSIHRQTA